MIYINTNFSSILELLETFKTQDICIKYLEKRRWEDKVVSPYTNNKNVYKCKKNMYVCRDTGKQFNVKTGTLFENTKIPLQKWFLAIWLITSHKKGISSLQLAKDIKVTQKTAWFVLQRIRNCFGEKGNMQLNGEVEADETYVGGKNKNRHADKKVKEAQGRSTKDKTPVVGMLERKGKLIAQVIKDVKKDTLHGVITKNVKGKSILYTDEWRGYKGIDKIYNHSIVKHFNSEYVKGNVHTNTIEGFWSILKRGIVGIYHFTSAKHLQKYVDEFVFRYNTKLNTEAERFNFFLGNTTHRITYKELIKL